MQDSVGFISSDAPAPGTTVSANNPCPFLRALVAAGFVDGHVVPLSKLAKTVEAAGGEKGLKARLVRLKTYLVALIANGLSPLRLLRNWWSGVQLDGLRDGPLDKHGSGSRILDKTAQVNEVELARLAEFGKDRPNPAGGFERGLTAGEITAYMDANFERAKGARRPIDRKLMNAEWPVLLKIMGKGEGEERYLSVAEVRTLVVERQLPDRVVGRLLLHPQSAAPTGRVLRGLAKAAIVLLALLGAAVVAIAEFPDQVRKLAPDTLLAKLLPPTLPARTPVKAAHWLDQNWSTVDRHWFHHAGQGTASFPVPYSWFIALEQPGIHLFTRPGMLADSAYLERFGFLPSPKSIRMDEASLQRFGYSTSPAAEPVPASVGKLQPTPVDNFDGLPIGFARMTGAKNPGTDEPESDKIGLTCAACHTGHITYKGTSVRFDGGPGMLELRQLERATGLSIIYTLEVWGRFDRFATRVLGPDASAADRSKLKRELTEVGDFVRKEVKTYNATLKAKSQKDTEEGFGRLDALNRIGNQVFYTDVAASGLSGYEKNLHANDAPVSFPAIWTVPWLLWAQYDGSIEQPLVRNVGEALGVSALVNMSPDYPPEKLFRSSVALENLDRIEKMLRGSNPFDRTPNAFGGLTPPKWPSHIFADEPVWKISQERVAKGRTLYAEICAECHLGPANDKVFDSQFPDQAFWSSKRWNKTGKEPVLMPVEKGVAGMGTDPAQADVLASRKIYVPGFWQLDPAKDLGPHEPCSKLPEIASTEMPFSVALMMVVERVSRKSMEDRNISPDDRKTLWGPRRNCPNPVSGPHYRARPLNGVWATAPYLHNGSVPSLYWLLKPAAERPTKFCIGARDFDPEQVGYRVEPGEQPSCKTGESLFSATGDDGKPIHGNSVLGHSLEGTPGAGKPGVIGRMLSEPERFDLIEYLKTL
jgi:cytochrome c5